MVRKFDDFRILLGLHDFKGRVLLIEKSEINIELCILSGLKYL